MSASPLPTATDDCVPTMSALCADTSLQSRPALWTAGRGDAHVSKQTVAAFLIVRGVHAWLGTGWQGCTDAPTTWQSDPLMATDPGTPTGLCEQASPGVFSRAFSRGTATLDCNTWEATLDFGGPASA